MLKLSSCGLLAALILAASSGVALADAPGGAPATDTGAPAAAAPAAKPAKKAHKAKKHKKAAAKTDAAPIPAPPPPPPGGSTTK